MKVVSIGAHPDDLEMGTAGTLSMHVERGDEVHGILCTLGGARGDPKDRMKEAEAAASVLGIKLHVMDYPVSKLNRFDKEFARILAKAIEEISPERIFTHSTFDYHQVHVAVAECTFKAAESVPQVLSYEVISSTSTEFRPNAFVDITKFMSLKIRALAQHKSQLADRPYIQPNVMTSLANVRYIWSKVGEDPNGLAEAFVIERLLIKR